jgi:hypothetical protein
VSFGPNNENSKIKNLKREVEQLESLLFELKNELKRKDDSEQWSDDKAEVEVNINRAKAR